MKNYGTIIVDGTRAAVFPIAGHDFAIYMPPCKKDGSDIAHAYSRSRQRNVNMTLLKTAIEQHIDEIIDTAFKSQNKQKVLFRWHNATIVTVVGMWKKKLPTLGIITAIDCWKKEKEGEIVFDM